ncbi:sodium/potassium/calcium exchanger 2-like isoform X2 [Tigriopus californicus]|uniref:sodium/potassium/calcium exchanger 2-like isoform X2 n=1 Tax=Tigriopus californicus TaxID=6832 RepID=UPI0027DA86B7|nr:sodium/potassium/calcium exchanger 2-like isoform X2 [Tigriopus californicus]
MNEGEGNFFSPVSLFTVEQLKNGAIILYIIGIIYVCYALVLVTAKFFFPSVMVLSEKLHLSPDLTGATILAVGRSMPDLLVAIVLIFFDPNPVDFGSVVGPACYKVAFIIGICALVTAEPLRLRGWPLMRDYFFYAICVVLLAIFFADDTIAWFEPVILLIWYGLYILFLAMSNKVEDLLRRTFKMSPATRNVVSSISDVGQVELDSKSMKNGKDYSVEQSWQMENAKPLRMSFPHGEGCFKIFAYLISLPIMGPLYVTLPDPYHLKRKFYLLTFIGSILWIALLTYLLIWWSVVVSQVLAIPDAVMGLLFLAAGTSIPDIVTSILVARHGRGDMVFSVSMSSNIFYITVRMSLPWLFFAIFRQETIPVLTSGMACSITLLALVLILVLVAVLIFRRRMTKLFGVILILIYILFVMVSLAFAFDAIQCPF